MFCNLWRLSRNTWVQSNKFSVGIIWSFNPWRFAGKHCWFLHNFVSVKKYPVITSDFSNSTHNRTNRLHISHTPLIRLRTSAVKYSVPVPNTKWDCTVSSYYVRVPAAVLILIISHSVIRVLLWCCASAWESVFLDVLHVTINVSGEAECEKNEVVVVFLWVLRWLVTQTGPRRNQGFAKRRLGLTNLFCYVTNCVLVAWDLFVRKLCTWNIL